MHSVLTWPVGRAANRFEDVRAPGIRPVVAYVAAAIVGGAGTGTMLGVLGLVARGDGAVRTVCIGTATIVVSLALLLQWRGRVHPLPERRRQVPRRWLNWQNLPRTAAAYGLMIGSGWPIYLGHAVAYCVAVVMIAAPSVATALVLGALYGLGRGSALIATWIGDRFLARRPPWQLLMTRRRDVQRTLAVAGLLTAMLLVSMR